MAYLLRLAFVCFLLLAGLPANALVPTQTNWTSGSCSASDPVEVGRCVVQASRPGAQITNCRITSGSTSDNYVGGYCHNGQYDAAWGAAKGAASCPANSIPAGGANCACSTGYFEVGGLCLNGDKNACFSFSVQGLLPGGALTQDYRFQGAIQNGTQMCIEAPGLSSGKGCKVTFDMDLILNYGPESVSEGSISMSPDSNTVDQSCTLGPGENPKPKPPEEKCPNGYTGTVNGVEVCIDKVPDSGNDGGKGNNDETETDDGTTTTRTTRDRQTSCQGGNCTTTTTTTTRVTNNATGTSTTSTSTSTTTQNQAAYCKENPGSKLCGDGDGNDSSFAGACGAGFQCEGDAIFCAIAQDQHKRHCSLFDDKTPESELYAVESIKTGKRTENLPGNSTTAFGPSLYDSSDALGAAGGCIADLSIDVLGQQVMLPISKVCPYLAWLRAALLAVGAVAWMVIVFRG